MLAGGVGTLVAPASFLHVLERWVVVAVWTQGETLKYNSCFVTVVLATGKNQSQIKYSGPSLIRTPSFPSQLSG